MALLISLVFRPSFITTDGIYRISGAHSDIQRIKQEIDKVLLVLHLCSTSCLLFLASGQLWDLENWGECPRSHWGPETIPQRAYRASDPMAGKRFQFKSKVPPPTTFYRTRVRSLAMVVTDKLTNSLAFSRLNACWCRHNFLKLCNSWSFGYPCQWFTY